MIPFTSIQREPESLRAMMLDAFARVADSGHWVLGREVAEFETAWASRCGTLHAVGTANGLDALEIALRAAGVGPQAEVITTPMTALATVLAISRAGATPVLADINPKTALLDVASAERCLSPRTRAMVPVHLYGNGTFAPIWRDFASANDLFLIEDCAQAHLSVVGGQSVGSFGLAGAFSFYPTKNLGALGDAGALVTNDDDMADRARMLRNYGQRTRYQHEVAGMNSRLDELQAALLIVRLGWLTQQTHRRRAVAEQLAAGICNAEVEVLDFPDESAAHVHHLFVVLCRQRDKLLKHLIENSVETLVHYPIPAHLQPPYQSVARDPDGLANSEIHATTCLSLPCHSGLTDTEVERIIEIVNSFKSF